MTPSTMMDKAKSAGLVKQDAVSPVLGVEGMDDRDGNLPRVQLMQDKATTLKNMQKAKIHAVAGQFVNSANETVPLNEVLFIPAYMTKFWDLYKFAGEKKEWIARTFREDDQALQGKRKRAEKQPDGSFLKAEVQLVITTVAIVEGYPTIINFKSTSTNAGKDLYSFASKYAKLENVPLWGKQYKLTSKEAKDKAGNEYYVMAVEPTGDSSIADQALAAAVYEGFKGRAAKLNPAAEYTEEEPSF